MMRIEAPFQTRNSDLREVSPLQKPRGVKTYGSSLVFDLSPSFIGRAFAYITRKISNFFRAIFSCCLPIKARSDVNLDEIEYMRSPDPITGAMKYQILVNGFSTNNEIKFKKIDDRLHLQEITFPDLEMREHIHAILVYMMEKEEVDKLGTEYLDRAKILWGCGFVSKDSVSFDPQGGDHSNKTIKKIIEEVQKKRGLLNAHYLEILQRVEKIMASQDASIQKLMGSFVDIAASIHIITPRLPGVSIPLTDLLSLLEIVDIGSVRGVRFANYGQGGLATFQDIAHS